MLRLNITSNDPLACKSIARFAEYFVRGTIAFVFGYSAVVKISQPADASTILGEVAHGSNFLMGIIIVAEFSLAIWVLCGWRLIVAAGVIGASLLVFSVFLAIQFLSDQPKACGCFGAAVKQQTADSIRHSLLWSLLRNALLFVACVWIAYFRTTRISSNSRNSVDDPVQ